MLKAWIENDRIRDICRGGDPFACYTGDIAKFYDTDVPDDAENGDGWVDGQLIKPEPPPPIPPPPRMWTADDVRAGLTLSEKVKWDNDTLPEIVTVKAEFVSPRNEADATELLAFLVEAGAISQASMDKILAPSGE